MQRRHSIVGRDVGFPAHAQQKVKNVEVSVDGGKVHGSVTEDALSPVQDGLHFCIGIQPAEVVPDLT